VVRTDFKCAAILLSGTHFFIRVLNREFLKDLGTKSPCMLMPMPCFLFILSVSTKAYIAVAVYQAQAAAYPTERFRKVGLVAEPEIEPAIYGDLMRTQQATKVSYRICIGGLIGAYHTIGVRSGWFMPRTLNRRRRSGSFRSCSGRTLMATSRLNLVSSAR
jgi:hypothetical protein